MKLLFKIIVIPILSIIAIPAIMLFLLYKGVNIPEEDFANNNNNVVLMDMVKDEFDAFLETHDETSTISLEVEQSEANGLLKNQFIKMNESFLDENATNEDKNYVIKEDLFGYQGSWVRFKENKVEIESGAHIFVSSFTYKTRLLLTFNLELDTEEVVLTLDKLVIGKLPLQWAFGVADWAVEKITGNDIGQTINNQLNGLATFDVAKREIRIEVQKLVDAQLEENPDQAALINSLMTFVDENELFSIGFNDESFDASLALGKLLDESTPYQLDASDKIIDEADLQAILENKVTSLLLSTLSTETTPYIEFSERTLNRVLDYMLKDQQQSPGILQSTTLFDSYIMEVYVPYITMRDDLFKVEIPISINSVNQPTHSFQTIIKINANPSIDGSDLVIELNSLNAGEVALEKEHVENILVLLGDVDFIQDGNIVIKDFDQQMNQAGMSIESVSLVNNKLRMYVQLDESINLVDLQDAIETVFDNLESNPNIPDEINEAIDDILNGTSDPDEAIDDFLEVFDDLSDTEQQEIFDSVLDGLEDEAYSLEDILGLLS